MRTAQARVKSRGPIGAPPPTAAPQGPPPDGEKPPKKLRRVSFSDVIECFDFDALSEAPLSASSLDTPTPEPAYRQPAPAQPPAQRWSAAGGQGPPARRGGAAQSGQWEDEDEEEIEDDFAPVRSPPARPAEAKSTTSKLPRKPVPTPSPEAAPEAGADAAGGSRRGRVWNSSRFAGAPAQAQQRGKPAMQPSPEAAPHAGRGGAQNGLSFDVVLPLGDLDGAEGPVPGLAELLQPGDVLVVDRLDPNTGQVLLRATSSGGQDARRQRPATVGAAPAGAQQPAAHSDASAASRPAKGRRWQGSRVAATRANGRTVSFQDSVEMVPEERYYEESDQEKYVAQGQEPQEEEEEERVQEQSKEPRNQFSEWIDNDPWEDELEFAEPTPKVHPQRAAPPPHSKDPPQRQEARPQPRMGVQQMHQPFARGKRQAMVHEPPDRVEEARAHQPLPGRTEDVRDRSMQAAPSARSARRIPDERPAAPVSDRRWSEERVRAEAARYEEEAEEEANRAFEAQERAARARAGKTASSRVQEEPRRQSEAPRQSPGLAAAEQRRLEQQQQQRQAQQQLLQQQQHAAEERRQEAAAKERRRQQESAREAAEAEERRRQERAAEERQREARRREEQAAAEAAAEAVAERRRALEAEKERQRLEEEENRRLQAEVARRKAEQAEVARRKAEQERKLLLESRKHELAAAKLKAKEAAEAVAKRREVEAEEAVKKASSKENREALRQAEIDVLAKKKEELKEVQQQLREQEAKRIEEESRRVAERAAAEQKARQEEAEAAARAEQIYEPDSRPHLHVALLGHERAGKSVLYGAILHAVGRWDQRALARFRKELGSQEETEVRRCGGLETKQARLMLLDVPGGKACLPEAGRALAEADAALLVVSAKGNEFDKAFDERHGPLREHALMAKGLGARSVIVAVNKMGEVQWSEARFMEIRSAFGDFLHGIGFGQDDVTFVPVDGLSGELAASKAPWHSKGGLLECITAVQMPGSDAEDLPTRVLCLEAAKEKTGVVVVEGRVECGTVTPGSEYRLAPLDGPCTVQAIRCGVRNVSSAGVGEAVQLRLQGVSDVADVPRGSVLSAPDEPVHTTRRVTLVMNVLELPQERPLLTVGSRVVAHIHALNTDCEILQITEAKNLSTGEVEQKPKGVRSNHLATFIVNLFKPLPVEEYAEGRGRLGLVAMRSDHKTVAVGRAVEVS